MVNRREFLRITVGTGAALALTPELLHALEQSGGKLIQRAIPSSGEKLPVIGLGRGWAKSLDPAAIKETIKTLVDNGGRVLDTVHGGVGAEEVMGTIASELGIQDKIFWSTKVTAPSSGPRPPGTAAPKVHPAVAKTHIEASFVTREDIFALFEGMLKKLWKDVLGTIIPTPFPRMALVDAMNRYGVDKPDVRFGLELVDLSDTFKNSAFKVFQATVAGGGVIKALNAKGLADLTQGELKNLEEIAKSLGAKGLAFIKIEGGEWKSPIVKFFSEAEKAELTEKLGIGEGDMIFFAAAPWEKASRRKKRRRSSKSSKASRLTASTIATPLRTRSSRIRAPG
jgi:hypothetical protein